MTVAVRSEVIEFASAPTAPWLARIETLPALRALLQSLIQVSTFDEQGRSECWTPECFDVGGGAAEAVRPAEAAAPGRRCRRRQLARHP